MSDKWVGELNGVALVFDPAIQLPNCPHIFLWNPIAREMEKYVAAMARSVIKSIKNDILKEQHISSYEDWRQTQGDEWLNSEKEYYTKRNHGWDIFSTPRTREDRHKVRLQEAKILYQGVCIASPHMKPRSSHCYECKAPLKQDGNLTCLGCRWIICHCGACGCGYYGPTAAS